MSANLGEQRAFWRKKTSEPVPPLDYFAYPFHLFLRRFPSRQIEKENNSLKRYKHFILFKNMLFKKLACAAKWLFNTATALLNKKRAWLAYKMQRVSISEQPELIIHSSAVF